MVDKEGSRLTTITAAIRAAAVEQRGAFSARSAAKRATLRAETTGRGSDLVRMDVVRWDAAQPPASPLATYWQRWSVTVSTLSGDARNARIARGQARLSLYSLSQA